MQKLKVIESKKTNYLGKTLTLTKTMTELKILRNPEFSHKTFLLFPEKTH